MEFFTNNTKRMVIIKDEGYVGIGNFTQTEVTATLDINGTTRIRNLPAGDAECLLVVADTNGNLKTRNMKDIEIALLKIENLENTIADLEQQIQYLTSQFAMLSKTDNE
ncbi:MAG: hypothetical protein KKA07_07705, partial [Bacteroidetes bacterium]|nr:hypothetical protein [Bacteroidota bacterium]